MKYIWSKKIHSQSKFSTQGMHSITLTFALDLFPPIMKFFHSRSNSTFTVLDVVPKIPSLSRIQPQTSKHLGGDHTIGFIASLTCFSWTFCPVTVDPFHPGGHLQFRDFRVTGRAKRAGPEHHLRLADPLREDGSRHVQRAECHPKCDPGRQEHDDFSHFFFSSYFL